MQRLAVKMQNLLALLLCCSIQHMLHASDSDPDRAKPAKGPDNIDVYTFTAKDITGKTVELSQYRGKVSTNSPVSVVLAT